MSSVKHANGAAAVACRAVPASVWVNGVVATVSAAEL